jgi:glycerate-2-kinase
MGIQGITSSTSATYSSNSSSDAVAMLEKQKAKLEADIKKVSQSKDDDKTKQQKIQLLRQQIQIIDAQIQQRKSVKTEQSSKASDTTQNKVDVQV